MNKEKNCLKLEFHLEYNDNNELLGILLMEDNGIDIHNLDLDFLCNYYSFFNFFILFLLVDEECITNGKAPTLIYKKKKKSEDGGNKLADGEMGA